MNSVGHLLGGRKTLLGRIAKLRLVGALVLAAAIGWFAGIMLLEAGIILAMLVGLTCPYLVARLAGNWELVAGPLVNLVMFASAIYHNYLWWLDHSDNPWRSFTRGLGRDVSIGLFFVLIGILIGARVRWTRVRRLREPKRVRGVAGYAFGRCRGRIEAGGPDDLQGCTPSIGGGL